PALILEHLGVIETPDPLGMRDAPARALSPLAGGLFVRGARRGGGRMLNILSRTAVWGFLVGSVALLLGIWWGGRSLWAELRDDGRQAAAAGVIVFDCVPTSFSPTALT